MKRKSDPQNTGLIGSRRASLPALIGLMAFFVLIGVYVVFRSHAASDSLSLSPASSSPALGSTFTVTVRENSGTDPVNAVQANITYPTSQLQITTANISFSTSAFATAAQATVSNGTINIARGTSGGTSVTGDQVVAVLTFTAIGTGTANVNFAAGSALVRSTDNTDVLVIKNNAVFTVVDATAPSVPSGVTAPSKGLTNINLSWTASTDNVGVTGYKIYRNGSQVGTSATTSYNDTGLTAGTSYTYTVAAYDAAGNTSAQSTAAAFSTNPDTTAPSVPTGLSSPSRTMTSNSLSWTASTDNVAVTGYRVYRNGTQVGTPSTNSYNDTGLAPGTSYSYTVAAYDAAGNLSAQSSASSFTTAPDTQAPGIPTGLKINSQTTSGVTLGWTASTDNVAVTGYKIFRNGTQVGTSSTTTYSDSGLSAGTTYNYTVAANDAAGNTSAQSSAVSVTISKTGDLNNDNSIDIFDLSILLSHYGTTDATSDLNHSGTVDVFDLSILLSNYGK